MYSWYQNPIFALYPTKFSVFKARASSSVPEIWMDLKVILKWHSNQYIPEIKIPCLLYIQQNSSNESFKKIAFLSFLFNLFKTYSEMTF